MKQEKQILVNRILVNRGTMIQLCKELGLSISPVRKALRGTVTTANHIRIRQRAIELGGVELPSTKR